MKWQLLMKCQAFESDSQDTATCTDQDEINISSIDGMEYREVYNIQQPLSSDEGKEHGAQNKHSLMSTWRIPRCRCGGWVRVENEKKMLMIMVFHFKQFAQKTSNSTECCTCEHTPPQLMQVRCIFTIHLHASFCSYPRREEYKKALNDRLAEHYNQEDTQIYLACSSRLHNSGM